MVNGNVPDAGGQVDLLEQCQLRDKSLRTLNRRTPITCYRDIHPRRWILRRAGREGLRAALGVGFRRVRVRGVWELSKLASACLGCDLSRIGSQFGKEGKANVKKSDNTVELIGHSLRSETIEKLESCRRSRSNRFPAMPEALVRWISRITEQGNTIERARYVQPHAPRKLSTNIRRKGRSSKRITPTGAEPLP